MAVDERTDRAKRARGEAWGEEPKLLASFASTTVTFALSRGVRLETITDATGISGFDLLEPEARLPDSLMRTLWGLIPPKRSDEIVPLEYAKAAPFSALGGLAHAAQFAGSLRDALTLLVDHSAVIADRLYMALREDGDRATFAMTHPNDALDGDEGRSAEAAAGLGWRLVRDQLGVPEALCGVAFAHARHGPAAPYDAFFGGAVAFEQGETAVLLNRDALDAPVSQSNAELFAFVQRHYGEVLRRVRREGYPAAVERLRAAIVENAAQGAFGVAAAAARARMSVRSAQRLAAANGETLQGLITRVRIENAKSFLRDPDRDVATVGMLVGYADERAFRRAFKRWTGRTPAQFRALGGPP